MKTKKKKAKAHDTASYLQYDLQEKYYDEYERLSDPKQTGLVSNTSLKTLNIITGKYEE